ncbi:hypothetical protein LTR94_036205, partial [Friedmanniomyces endolithicus]
MIALDFTGRRVLVVGGSSGIGNGIAQGFRAAGAVDALPEIVGTVLFRIAQEALTNVERHAQARHIDMVLERVGDL